MSLISRIKGFAAIDPAVKPVVTLGPHNVKPGARAKLSQAERDRWMQIASQRNPPRQRDVDFWRGLLYSRNPRKYNQLVTLMRWAENELQASHDLLPEDVRWLLP